MRDDLRAISPRFLLAMTWADLFALNSLALIFSPLIELPAAAL